MNIPDATETAYKNGYAQGVKDAADNNVGSKWIPVTERLPEMEKDAFTEWGGRYEYEISPWVLGVDACGTLRIVQYERGWAFTGWADDEGTTYEITHWTELPEAPKEEIATAASGLAMTTGTEDVP